MCELCGREHPPGTACGWRAEAHAADVSSIFQIGSVAGSVNAAGPLAGAEVPRQVPAPPVTFVDRDELLAWLNDQLADPEKVPRIAVVAGLPGIGKRAAARRWVHQSRNRFPGGDLHLDCADYGGAAGEGMADVSGMLGSCLRALGVGDNFLPATLPDRIGLFRTRTARAPVLVLVENVTEPVQVKYLIPNAPGSLVLVTSSADLRELSLDGAGFYYVGGLDEAAGAELLAKVCGSQRVAEEPQGVADLVRLSAGLPIALSVLGARAEGTRGTAISELVAELSDEERRLAGLALGGRPMVSPAFTPAYRRLPGAARLLYRRLALLPGTDFGDEIAGVVADSTQQEARRLLEALVAAHLVDARGGGRYAFHDLVRLHAREMAEQEEASRGREAAVHAVIRHHLVKAAFADRAVMGTDRARAADHDVLLAERDDPFSRPDPDDAASAALAWLDAERANLVPVLQAAAGNGWDNEAWQLAEALMAYYYNRRHLTDWITVAGLGVGAAQRCGDIRAEARLRLAVSRAYTDLREFDRAREEIDAAAELARGSGDLALQASACEFLGRYLDVTDPRHALAAYDCAYDLNLRAEEWRGVALVLYFTGCALEAAGQNTQALEKLRQAWDMFRWLGHPRMPGRTLIAIGAAQAGLGLTADAASSLEEAVRELKGLHYEAQAMEKLARLAEQAGDHAAAQLHLCRAVAVYADVGHPRAAEIATQLDNP
jgi:tetratricopeptide (TPR) repeat protein